MNILIVSQYFYPENFRINDMAAGMVERGHQVTVLTGIPNYPAGNFFAGYGLFSKAAELWRGVKIIRAPLIPRGSGGGLRLALNYFSFAILASIWGMFRLERDFDVIFVHEPSPVTVGIPAIVMKKLTSAPIFFWVLDIWPDSVSAAGNVENSLVLGMLARMTRWIYSHCDRLLLQSRGFMEHAREMGVMEERIKYFPSWAESLYMNKPNGDVSDLLPKGFCLLFAGNVGVAQDFPSILAAAELLRDRTDIHWVIVGDGRMLPWVKEEVAKRNLENTVHLLGKYPLEAMPNFFSQADALLVSLKRDPIFSNTIPGKVQSYLACGRPIVAMLDGEGARIVEEAGVGMTCPAEDAGSLAGIVKELSQKSDRELSEMGENGKSYCKEHFDRDTLFSRLETWVLQWRTNK